MIIMDDRFLKETTPDEMWLMLHITKYLKERENTCWPSNETMIAVTGWSESKFRQVRRDCIKKGFLRLESRFAKNGTQTSNIYHVETERLAFMKSIKGMFGVEKPAKEEQQIPENDGVVNYTTLPENNMGEGSKSNYPHYIEQTEIHIEPVLNVVCEQTTIVSPKLKERLNCKNSKHEAAVVEIVDYFNLVTGRKTEYHSKGQLKYLLHWLNEGYAVDDFKAVIDYKTNIFKGTPNENYIALDTYCRFDKFEENLTKSKNTPQATTDASLADCELSQEQAEQYAKARNYILVNYPNLKDVRFFSHREFLAFSTNDVNDFLPIAWRVKATERKMKDWKLALMDKLNTNVFERKACGSLYGYIKDGIREQLKKEN